MTIRPDYDPMEPAIRAARRRGIKAKDAAADWNDAANPAVSTPPRADNARQPVPAGPQAQTGNQPLANPAFIPDAAAARYGPPYKTFDPAVERANLGRRISEAQNDIIRRQIQGVPFDRLSSLEHIAQLRREYAALDASQARPQSVLTPMDNVAGSAALAKRAAELGGSGSPVNGWMSMAGRFGGAAGSAIDSMAFAKGAAASAAQARARESDMEKRSQAYARYLDMRDARLNSEQSLREYGSEADAKTRALSLSDLGARIAEADRRRRIASNPQLDAPGLPVGPEAQVAAAKANYLTRAYEEATKQVGVLSPMERAARASEAAGAETQMQDIAKSKALPQYESVRRGVDAIAQLSGKVPRGDAGFALGNDIRDADSAFDALPESLKGAVASEMLRSMLASGVRKYEEPSLSQVLGYVGSNWQDVLTLSTGGFVPGSNRDIVMARVAANKRYASSLIDKIRRYADAYAKENQ